MKAFSNDFNIKKLKTRQKLRCYSALLCLLFVTVCGISCLPKSKDPLEYRLFPFTAQVSAYYPEGNFDAVFSLPISTDTADRDFHVRFISPESLVGINVSKCGEDLKIFLEDTEYIGLPSSAFSRLRLISFAEMLSPSGPIKSIISVRGAECGLPSFASLTAVTVGDNVIYIDPESELPVQIHNIKSGEYLIINSISIEKQ